MFSISHRTEGPGLVLLTAGETTMFVSLPCPSAPDRNVYGQNSQ